MTAYAHLEEALKKLGLDKFAGELRFTGGVKIQVRDGKVTGWQPQPEIIKRKENE